MSEWSAVSTVDYNFENSAHRCKDTYSSSGLISLKIRFILKEKHFAMYLYIKKTGFNMEL